MRVYRMPWEAVGWCHTGVIKWAATGFDSYCKESRRYPGLGPGGEGVIRSAKGLTSDIVSYLSNSCDQKAPNPRP